MIDVEKILAKPQICRRLIGIEPGKFMELLLLLEPLWVESRNKKLSRKNRIRELGGGRKSALTVKQMLFLTLLYYRIYTSQEFIGFLFNLNQGNVSRCLKLAHPLLARIFRIPERKIEMKEDEIIEVIFDATEQEVFRPGGKGRQKKYYSGKKKRHTVKHQIVVDKKGRILAVSKSFAGKMHDKALYDKTKVYGCGWVKGDGDLGYQGTDLNKPHKKPKNGILTNEQKAWNKAFSSVRVRVEHVLRRMKIFRVLADEFRNPLNDHCVIFKNVAGLCNFARA